jgi:hypothetical protein
MQLIDIRQFCLLVDLESDIHNLSRFVRRNNSTNNDEISMTVHFVQSDDISDKDQHSFTGNDFCFHLV